MVRVSQGCIFQLESARSWPADGRLVTVVTTMARRNPSLKQIIIVQLFCLIGGQTSFTCTDEIFLYSAVLDSVRMNL